MQLYNELSILLQNTVEKLITCMESKKYKYLILSTRSIKYKGLRPFSNSDALGCLK